MGPLNGTARANTYLYPLIKIEIITLCLPLFNHPYNITAVRQPFNMFGIVIFGLVALLSMIITITVNNQTLERRSDPPISLFGIVTAAFWTGVLITMIFMFTINETWFQ